MDTNLIEVRLARLGSEMKTFSFERGITVGQVVDISGINGDAHTLKLNGVKVGRDTVLTMDSTLVAIAELEAGLDEDTSDEQPKSAFDVFIEESADEDYDTDE